MPLKYVSPAKMEEFEKNILLFFKGADSAECVGSHYLPERNGSCDLSGEKELDELFVLANRAGNTMKLSRSSLDIVANILDIQGAAKWFEKLKEQKKAYREKEKQRQEGMEQERKSSSRVVLRRKRPR